MEIRAKCHYNLDAINALVRLSMFKRNDPKKRMILWTILYALLFGVILLEKMIFRVDLPLDILFIIEFATLLYLYFGYFLLPKIRYHAMSKMKEIANEYIFYDDQLHVSSNSEDYHGTAEIKYDLFVRVYETSRYLFLYETKNQVFLVEKSTLSGGTIEELRKKFAKGRYVLCNY